ncbi:hypothetical protein ACVFI8_11195 [Agarivorans sp. MS3-6]
MTTSYGSAPLQTNDVAYKPNLLKVNEPQVTPSAGFGEKLQSALLPDAPEPSSVAGTVGDQVTDLSGGSDILDVAPAAMDIGVSLASGNPVAAGLAGADLLQSVLKADIEAQFTDLGQGIAAALVAGLSGDPSATAVLPSAEELAEQAALVSADIVANGSQQVANASNNVLGNIGTSQEGKSTPTKGTIPKAFLDNTSVAKEEPLLNQQENS